MLTALALVAYLVQPGDTLSGIAASHGASLAAVKAANPQLADPDMIYAGQSLEIPEGSSASHGSYTPQSYTAPDSGSQSAPAAQSTPAAQTGPAAQSAPSSQSPSSIASATAPAGSGGSSGYSSSSLSDIPGVPQALAACVANAESTNLQNPAANGNAYGILPASGYDVSGTSVAHQKQVFAQLYQQYGGSPWASDGCPGT